MGAWVLINDRWYQTRVLNFRCEFGEHIGLFALKVTRDDAALAIEDCHRTIRFRTVIWLEMNLADRLKQLEDLCGVRIPDFLLCREGFAKQVAKLHAVNVARHGDRSFKVYRRKLPKVDDLKTCLRPFIARRWLCVNGGAKLVHPGGAKLVHLMLCGTRCWGVVPVVHRRDPRCFVSRLRYAERSSVGGSCGPTGSTIAPAVKQVFLGISAVFGFG